MIGLHRNTTLLTTPAAVRFVSAEPLLGPIDLRAAAGTMGDRDWRSHHADVDWMIIGGKSGHGARPMHPDWPGLRDQCAAAGVAFFSRHAGTRAWHASRR